MKSDYDVEECPCYGCRCVGVAERDEVRTLGESVDHREHHRFAGDAWKCLNEIHCVVGLDHLWHLEGLEEADRVQVLRLVPLARCAGTHKFGDDGAAVMHVNVGVQLVQRLDDAFVSHAVRGDECLLDIGRGGWLVNAAFDDDQVVLHVPSFTLGACSRFLP
jgi:hypothetical protein